MKEINALKVVSEVFQMEKLLRGLWDHRFASYPFKIHRVYQFQVNLFQSRFGTITFASMQKSNLKKWSFKIIGHFQLCKNILVGKIFFCKTQKNKGLPNVHRIRREQKLQPYIFALKEIKASISNVGTVKFEKNWTPDLAFAILTQAYNSQESVIWISFSNHALSRLSSILKSSALCCGSKRISGKNKSLNHSLRFISPLLEVLKLILIFLPCTYEFSFWGGTGPALLRAGTEWWVELV